MGQPTLPKIVIVTILIFALLGVIVEVVATNVYSSPNVSSSELADMDRLPNQNGLKIPESLKVFLCLIPVAAPVVIFLAVYYVWTSQVPEEDDQPTRRKARRRNL